MLYHNIQLKQYIFSFNPNFFHPTHQTTQLGSILPGLYEFIQFKFKSLFNKSYLKLNWEIGGSHIPNLKTTFKIKQQS